MLKLNRHHDFQLFLSPQNGTTGLTNPPSFNWPQPCSTDHYDIELEHIDSQQSWQWQRVQSPFLLPYKLSLGSYRWRLTDIHGVASAWMQFTLDHTSTDYLPPTAAKLFELCQNKSQFLMYFDQDIEVIRAASTDCYATLKQTASLAVDATKISYPDHYRRGHEAGKRTAITNVREWIDRDLIALTLLYKIWGETDSGEHAIQLLLALAQWSPEGPASLRRPLTWGDEVGLSLSRNLFLVYHWLSPLLTASEKEFVRPMLIRIAYQMEDRFHQDEFQQFPGHSHTSRLPAYLGVAALVLHKEFDRSICERWLNYALMIYRGVLPFYGGKDGSWAEGPFYSSSYSKWQHPFFLAVERLSGFSFYEHPFYKNYCQFAIDFVASEQSIHPFGDGFWCKRESVEWPGFFAQNPLRIYAERFGDLHAYQTHLRLEAQIKHYSLHLLDVIPTLNQLTYRQRAESVLANNKETVIPLPDNGRYYDYGGFGIATRNGLSLSYRASQFANSSHRHADQGNIALFDNGIGVLTPTGSYGYCFGSKHHQQWTRTTQAHNLPLINGIGQILDNQCATAKLISQSQGKQWYCAQIDLSAAYLGIKSFIRTLFLIANKGIVIVDQIELPTPQPIQWRLHSHIDASAKDNCVNLSFNTQDNTRQVYQCRLINHLTVQPSITTGYQDEIPYSGGIESDATTHVQHLCWDLAAATTHTIVAGCLTDYQGISFTVNQGLTIKLEQETLLFNKILTSQQHDKELVM